MGARAVRTVIVQVGIWATPYALAESATVPPPTLSTLQGTRAKRTVSIHTSSFYPFVKFIEHQGVKSSNFFIC